MVSNSVRVPEGPNSNLCQCACVSRRPRTYWSTVKKHKGQRVGGRVRGIPELTAQLTWHEKGGGEGWPLRMSSDLHTCAVAGTRERVRIPETKPLFFNNPISFATALWIHRAMAIE